HRRHRDIRVHFTTGTDDNSLKNVVAAARERLPTRTFVDRNAAAFRALVPLLGITIDDFISTSTDPRHAPIVNWLWHACAANGDLYRRAWHGRYCAGCEAFVDDDVTICPEHDTEPEPVTEDNWFFRLSRYADAIRDAITSNRVRIVPDSARTETLAFLAGPVHDLSVSRDVTRAQGWGIPVPDDPSQVIYVWFDALANYLTVVGLDGWRALVDRTHVIGKGITRFHAVYWLAFLLSANLPLPENIFVHGYLTVDGYKISKSGRHRVAVPPIVDEAGLSALRWFFIRHCRTRADADVSIDAILHAHNRDLVDGLGNLVQRCCVLGAKLGGIPRRPAPAVATALASRVDAALATFAPDEAATAIVELVTSANRQLEATAPWRVAKTDPQAAAELLAGPLEIARIVAHELVPFVPEIADVIANRIRAGGDGPPPLARRTRAAV
ncbi:MAG TPA: methionine--tRNA ligase, partial [Kofleriaceae bacterium]|nr:methionine--tRNA ligase [Kofleriaceae bacterium]